MEEERAIGGTNKKSKMKKGKSTRRKLYFKKQTSKPNPNEGPEAQDQDQAANSQDQQQLSS